MKKYKAVVEWEGDFEMINLIEVNTGETLMTRACDFMPGETVNECDIEIQECNYCDDDTGVKVGIFAFKKKKLNG